MQIKGIPAKIRRALLASFLVLVGVPSPAGAEGGTVEKVLRDGRLRCGVSESLPGIAFQHPDGHWSGFIVDFCRAVAAAILGDGQATDFLPNSSAGSLPILLSGRVDLLAAATVTFGREAAIGVVFPGVYYLDGQSLLVPKSGGARRIEDLGGATVCVLKGSTSVTAVENAFRRRSLGYTPLVFETRPDQMEALRKGSCQALAGVRTGLVADLNQNPANTSRFEILPEYISKEPIGPVVRRGDERWAALVRWVLYALIEAEERDITRDRVATQRDNATDPIVRGFLLDSGPLGKTLGLRPDWVVQVIAAVGNYGEMFERHLGSGSPLKLDRGYNRLWKQGGLLYSPPFQ